MEADWEVELGGEAPVIYAFWPGFIDLQRFPERVAEIAEMRQLPTLGEILVRLNHPRSSPVWTAKCDVWTVDAFDPDELDAPPESAQHALACYIDLLPRSDQQWSFPAKAVADCKALCAHLRSVALRCCRADFIVRGAFLTPGTSDLGITAYLTACGAAPNLAASALSAAAHALADALAPISGIEKQNS
ncbi:MAG TPA: hypothetical protein VK716_02340 [Terracidiphilus sp.]|jgi:hypothetical protein|nr:hypothetical protein [Terracidiphilus sp.]